MLESSLLAEFFTANFFKERAKLFSGLARTFQITQACSLFLTFLQYGAVFIRMKFFYFEHRLDAQIEDDGMC